MRIYFLTSEKNNKSLLLRTKVLALGVWETIHNPNFKGVEFDPLLAEAGSNAFTMSPTKWVELTSAIGILTKNGVGGGTYAQRDIAFKFANWVSVEFELYLVMEFQRLKTKEQEQIGWTAKRELQEVLGYARWEKFVTAVGRAVESYKELEINVDDHFREVTKMIALAKGAQREVQDFMLTRYACYLIAQNGDPKKEEIAFAQSYFAVQTRKTELIEERLNEIARLSTRERLRVSEKQRRVAKDEKEMQKETQKLPKK